MYACGDSVAFKQTKAIIMAAVIFFISIWTVPFAITNVHSRQAIMAWTLVIQVTFKMGAVL